MSCKVEESENTDHTNAAQENLAANHPSNIT